VGDKVNHPLLGTGVVLSINDYGVGPIATIQFPSTVKEFRVGLSILKKV
jgi:hypothetical protein